MNKQSKKPAIPATASAVILAERGLLDASVKADATVASWFVGALDARRGNFPKDRKGTAALQAEMQAELIEAARVYVMTPKSQGGAIGMKKAAVDKVGTTWFKVLGLAIPKGRVGTYRAYFSGIARAHAHEMAWTPESHNSPDRKVGAGLPKVPWADGDAVPTEGGIAPKAKEAGAAVTTKASPAGIQADVLAAVIAAAGMTADRTAELVAFAKAKGWI
jgi:hypothetical protein